MNKKHLKYIIIIVIIILMIFLIFLSFNNKEYSSNSNSSKLSSTRIIIEDEKEEEIQYEYYVENNKEDIIYTEIKNNNIEKDDTYKNNIELEEEIIIEDVTNLENEDNEIESSDLEEDISALENNENEIEENDEQEIEEEKNEEIQEEKNIKIDDNILIEDKTEDMREVKNGFIEENGNTYYYENDEKVVGIKEIDGIKHYFKANGVYLGTNNIKVIDVSYYQGIINWDKFLNESDCYGVILRLGYYNTLDTTFERNLLELKRLNIPYGIYLFSYAKNYNDAVIESNFTNEMISKYDIKPQLGIYYDIEQWSTKKYSSNNISKNMYDTIINTFVNSVSNYVNNSYKVKLYSGRWYAMNRLNINSKNYVDWVAEYNSTCKYDSIYSMWQFTSKSSVPGIDGNVDMSYIIN